MCNFQRLVDLRTRRLSFYVKNIKNGGLIITITVKQIDV